MTLKLFFDALFKVILGIILVGILLFLPAGTFLFPNGWLLMAVLFIPMLIAGVVLIIRNQDLLKRRLNARETQKEQRLVIFLSAIIFIAGFSVAGLDFRFGWTELNPTIIAIAMVIFLIAYLLYAEVMRENTYLSRTIEVQENQRVIDTGVYAVVRHPMYAATIFLFLSMPIILGSIPSFLIFLAYPFVIVERIKFEEEFLEKELPEYREYKDKVKYRLIPFLW